MDYPFNGPAATDTSYYFFETEDLSLFGPLRTLGVPESTIDVLEPPVKDIVDQGYDRRIRRGSPHRRGCSHRLIQWKRPTEPATAVGKAVTQHGGSPRVAAPMKKFVGVGASGEISDCHGKACRARRRLALV